MWYDLGFKHLREVKIKKSDVDAIAVKILLIALENNQISPIQPGYNAKYLLAEWSEFLQKHGDDNINLSLINHLDD